jgi:V8-like Glu-specific endopeptidase
MRLLRLVLMLALFLSAFGCTRARPLATQEAAIVYGNDDRTEVYSSSDSAYRDITMDSIVAFMSPDAIDMSNSQNVRFSSEDLSSRYGLCSGERFSNQPTAAWCSGTLIDDDLVLTAGHCITSDADCRGARIVFNYYYESNGTLATVTSSDVFSCTALRAHALVDGRDGNFDYAIIQLDRPAAPRHSPARVSTDTRRISEGTDVTVIGSGSGLPAKIDTGGSVRSARATTRDYFVATTDTFGGNSGSGVFDNSSHDLVGILVRGDTDYVLDGGCYRVNTCSENSCGGESITYVANAVDDYCASYTSQALCDTAATCGDGYCAGSEDNDSCPADCDALECGNGICESGESESCPDDCTIPGPEDWTCEPSYYDTLDGCDCNCGSRDPDCDDPGQILLNCSSGEICNVQGSCSTPQAGDCGDGTCDSNESAGSCPSDCGGEIPGTWFCDPDLYGVLDGCDCECGAYDPDCDTDERIYGCSEEAVCLADGSCSVQEWFCDPGFFDSLDGCDCDCGLRDPDCDISWQELLNCTEEQFCNEIGRCASSGTPPPQRACAVVVDPKAGAPLGWLACFLVGALGFRRRKERRQK